MNEFSVNVIVLPSAVFLILSSGHNTSCVCENVLWSSCDFGFDLSEIFLLSNHQTVQFHL